MISSIESLEAKGMQRGDEDGTVLVTGAAGFLGAHVSARLVREGYRVVGVDNFNDYYSPALKEARVAELLPHQTFTLHRCDLQDLDQLGAVFDDHRPTRVVHLAAQAGVRYSIEHPSAYFASNVSGFFNVLELSRVHQIQHLVYASSSAVYGENEKVPFEESDRVDSPVSFYAATKRCDELMAHAYAHNHGLPATGLRFFTVYGPMGRPDMAYFGFTDKFFRDESITVFNAGDEQHDLYRDFTYVDDVVEGVLRILTAPPQTVVPHDIYNIGNSSPVTLTDFIRQLEEALSASLDRPVELKKTYRALQVGDVPATYASTDKLEAAVGYRPSTPLSEGLRAFTDWYVDFYGVS